jgi:NADH-quinone oxidoreductase subunit G
MARLDAVASADSADLRRLAELGGTPDHAAFRSPIEDFYLTNAIARASAIMGECSGLARRAATSVAAE